MIDAEESQEGWTNNVVVRSNDFSTRETQSFHTRGGWLCSEVGMGKTAVVIALVASRPTAAQNVAKVQGRTRLKATVVMTSVSLMGQVRTMIIPIAVDQTRETCIRRTCFDWFCIH